MRLLLAALFFSASFHVLGQDVEHINIPVDLVSEDAPFPYGMGISTMREIDSVGRGKRYHITRIGVPQSWKEGGYYSDQIVADYHQLVYQNAHKDHFTQEERDELLSGDDMQVDGLIKDDINISVGFIFRPTHKGIELILDANNNRDYSDDEVHLLEPFTNAKDSTRPRSRDLFLTFVYEYVDGVEIVEAGAGAHFVADSIRFSPTNSQFLIMSESVGYGKSTYKGHEIYVDSEILKDELSPYASLKIKRDSNEYEEIRLKSYFYLDEQLYQFDSVITSPPSILLSKLPQGYIPIAPQEGFVMPSFSGVDVITRDTISTETLKGKYVYIDVWGSWCSPCIMEIPNIKKAIVELEGENITFIAIGQDDITALKNAMEQHGVTWPNIHNTTENDIVKAFNVRGYPTTFLLDPEGKVVSKGLRGENLADDLRAVLSSEVKSE